MHRRHWVASSSKFIGECTVSMLKNWHYLIESCLNLNLNLEFWSGDSQSEYFYAQKTLNNKLWPSFRNKLIKSNFWGKKNWWPRSWRLYSNGQFGRLRSAWGDPLRVPKVPERPAWEPSHNRGCLLAQESGFNHLYKYTAIVLNGIKENVVAYRTLHQSLNLYLNSLNNFATKSCKFSWKL